MPFASTAYTPSDPPAWFLGGSAVWNLARELFVQGQRLHRHGAQHVLLGMVLLPTGLALGLAHAVAMGWAIGATGVLATVHGHRQQRLSRSRSALAIESIMVQCDNPTMGLWADPQDKDQLAVVAHRARLTSPAGSFDELLNAVAEACLTGRSVQAPAHWWYGQRFRGFVDGPSVGTVATPPDDRPDA